MTVAELLKHLHQYPEDMPVLVQGYETGWDDIVALRTTDVEPYRKANEWDGEYQEAGAFRHPGARFPVVLIEGRRGHRRVEQRIGVAKGLFDCPEG